MKDTNVPYYLSTRPAEIELIRSMAAGTLTAKQSKEIKQADQHPANTEGAFIISDCSAWLRAGLTHPEAAKLFDSFWFEGELCILFADTNVGKSVLAVQIGDSISRGLPVGSFEMKAKPSVVLYFDFELSSRQFAKRYTHGLYGNYEFAPGFLRAVTNPELPGLRKFDNYEQYIHHAIENSIMANKAKVLIIDNITCLGPRTQAAGGALKLMQQLKNLKKKYHLSILVLAHTPKRNPAKPISRNDLQGSKMLINFCDSAFAIGESQSVTGLKYLKQIKQRNTPEIYGAGRVYLCRIDKPYNFLQFDFLGTGYEYEHLMHYTEQQRAKNEQRVAELHKQGLSHRQIAHQLQLSYSGVFRMLKQIRSGENGVEDIPVEM